MTAFTSAIANKTHVLLSSAASDNATLVWDDLVAIKVIQGHNAAAAPCYLKIYNKGTVPAPADAPVLVIYLPPATSFILNYETGIELEAGLGYRLVAGLADSDATAVADGDIIALNIAYTGLPW